MPAAFRTVALSPELLAVVEELGFDNLTAIQTRSIPVLLEGKDLIGRSQTGSGKTAAFALPILQMLSLQSRELHALVLCPTRELCMQVAREFRKLGRRHPGLVVAVLSGGEPVYVQTKVLRAGAHVAIGTPGRVIDHLGRNNLRINNLRTVVLDEADRMLDMGFKADIAKILLALPTSRQTVFFSATFPNSVESLSREYQQSPELIGIDTEAIELPNIRQFGIRVDAMQKRNALLAALKHFAYESALIFANQKLTVVELEAMLARKGVSVASLHGDLEQFDRNRIMAKFRNGSTRVLVATDVAARGIHLDDLDLVVNFDLPTQPEIYVHRIGRTGRAGRTGCAVSLCEVGEQPRLDAIQLLTQVPLRFESTTDCSNNEGTTKEELTRTATMDTLVISGGRKDKLRPGDILGALTGSAGGLSGDDIGKIEIFDHFAYVAVSKETSNKALVSLREGRIKAKRFKVAFAK
jgi:ATP-independent RNA helicase DbpA